MFVKQITAQQLKQRLQQDGELPLLIDVREPDEFSFAQIQGSVLIPLNQIQLRFDELDKQ